MQPTTRHMYLSSTPPGAVPMHSAASSYCPGGIGLDGSTADNEVASAKTPPAHRAPGDLLPPYSNGMSQHVLVSSFVTT